MFILILYVGLINYTNYLILIVLDIVMSLDIETHVLMLNKYRYHLDKQ